jgi:4-methyl-5(b-hydroxyethyl)-thiazole monophosphate biosynthesis
MTKKVLLLLHPGFEEIEAVTCIDILRRAGAEVTAASVTGDLKVPGGKDIAVTADALLSECIDQPFDMLVIPGGPGVEDLRKKPEALYAARKFYRDGKFVAAICAAPLVLLDAGVLTGHTVTSFPGTENELRGKVRAYTAERVSLDGKLITSRGAGTAEEFALSLVRVLLGPAASEQVRQRIVAR